MRRLTHLYRTATVLTVGLAALANPLTALANTGGPSGC